MRTTIDSAGRVVIPSPLRKELGLRGGEELDVALRDGTLTIEPVSKPMQLVEREGFLAAEVAGVEGPPLTAEEVRDLLERLRR